MNSALRLLFKPIDWVLFSPDKENKFLETCYGPVKDEVTGECEVEGVIPPAVRGEFARIGPNPRFTPKGGYHWFDGDGMVHAVRIKADKVTFSNRYIKTAKLAREEKEGGPVFENLGELRGRGAILRLLNHTIKKSVGYTSWKRQSKANTAMTFHGGQLMALWEGGLPYALKMMCDGVIETIGEATFNGNLKAPFTAHPKEDPATGKLYGIGYQLDAEPHVTFFVLDVEGNVERQFPLPVDRPTMMHDISITETHAVFLDVPLMLDPSAMLSGKLPIVFKKEAGARIGVLPLDATDGSSMRWFKFSEGFCSFHFLNGWDVMGKGSESGPEKIQAISCDFMDFDLSLDATSNDHSYMPRPYLSTVDLNTGKVTREEVLPLPQPEDPCMGYDFPIIRKSLLGRRMRYGYCVELDGIINYVAVVKIDTQASSPEQAIVGRISFGEGMVGGECPFIPAGDEEDDGYIATFVSKADGTGTSDFCIWNAKTMESKPVARIKLPQRVPAGFHAIFMSEEDLANQRA